MNFRIEVESGEEELKSDKGWTLNYKYRKW
jgi:hypothetical protein